MNKKVKFKLLLYFTFVYHDEARIMGSEKGDIFSLDINPRILDGVRKAKLKNLVQVLTLSENELMRLTQLSPSDVCLLQNSAATGLCKSVPVTALQLFSGTCPSHSSKYFLSTGCSIIDKLLREGIMSGVLTEISGESATGKTQLCLQMCLTVQLTKDWGGFGGGAVYVSTEDAFPSARLVDMANRLRSRFAEFEKVRFTDNIYIEKASDCMELLFCLKSKIPHLISKKDIKLIVVDSVAGIMRADQQEGGLFERNRNLCSIAWSLRCMATTHNIPVLLVNQVTDDSSSCTVMGGGARKTLPALGLMWANLMNVRIFLSRTSEYVTREHLMADGEKKPVEVNVRTMEILSAPHLPNLSCRFIVDEEGVKGLKQT